MALRLRSHQGRRRAVQLLLRAQRAEARVLPQSRANTARCPLCTTRWNTLFEKSAWDAPTQTVRPYPTSLTHGPSGLTFAFLPNSNSNTLAQTPTRSTYSCTPRPTTRTPPRRASAATGAASAPTGSMANTRGCGQVRCRARTSTYARGWRRWRAGRALAPIAEVANGCRVITLPNRVLPSYKCSV